MTLIAALALGALAPSFAVAQAARPSAQSAAKKAPVRKAAVKKTQKKVTCRYQVRQGKKVRICK
jgi:hypothetical protein